MKKATNEKISNLKETTKQMTDFLNKMNLEKTEITQENFSIYRDEILAKIKSISKRITEDVTDLELTFRKEEINNLSAEIGEKTELIKKKIIEELSSKFNSYEYKTTDHELIVRNPKNRYALISKIPENILRLSFPLGNGTPILTTSGRRKYNKFCQIAEYIIKNHIKNIEIRKGTV